MQNNNIFTRRTNLNYLGSALAISLLLPTTSVMADGTVECNVGIGSGSTECGISSDASGNSAIAIGAATASGDFGIATGVFSTAAGYRGVAHGIGAKADSDDSISLGSNANWNGGIAVADSPYFIAIGFLSSIGALSPDAIAIGRNTSAAASGAIALGEGAANNVADSMLINVPFRIEGASPPVNALYLTANTISIGTPTPAKTVHILKSDGTAAMRIEENSTTVQKRYQMQLENNGPTGFKFSNNANGSVWQFSQTPAGGFGFANTANGGQDFVMNSDGRVLMGPGSVTNFNLAPDGDLEIPNGSVTATTFHSSSSRATKKDFTKVDTDKLMANIKAMEVTEWRYKDENTKGRHIGPMAEDFYAMFGLGPDDKHVTATDMASIALIAAKELQKKSDSMKIENKALKARLASLEKLVMNLASGKGLLPENVNKVVLKQ